MSENAEDTPLRSLVGKSMHLIAKSRDCSKDEASFMLAGGMLYFTSQSVRMCSMSAISLQDIGDVKGNPKSFTFESLRKRYEARIGHDFVNLYTWVAEFSQYQKAIAPYFFGLNMHPSFPLEEEYSKHILQLFKPYRGCLGHNTFLSYADALTSFMDEEGSVCPLEIIRALRAKRERFITYIIVHRCL